MPDEVRAAADVVLDDAVRGVARALSALASAVEREHAVAGRAASDPVDPAQDDSRQRRQRHHDRGDRPEPAALAAIDRGCAASLIPKIPATAPIPARMTVTPVSRFMITDRLLLTWVR